jgi:CHASE3 domain sensor protein
LHHEFIKAVEDAEAALISAERQRLKQMDAREREKLTQERERAALRRGQRALAATAVLFICVCAVSAM